jgi:Stress responsive A/B Barrel Domain
MVRHTVVFRLRHPAGSAEESGFLRAAREQLTPIPGVERFEVLRQTGSQSAYAFSLSMEFADDDLYAGYNAHPAHQAFVKERWIPEVEEFLELDFVPVADGANG